MRNLLLTIILPLAFLNSTYGQDTLKTDTSKRDTVKTDTLFKTSRVKISDFKAEDFKRVEYPETDNKSTSKLQKGVSAQLSTVTTYDAGRTAGSLEVASSGAATYTVPISVPPGINGVVPQLALTYNSQGGNGLAGFGWNISGLSTISRIPKTRFHDNSISGINYDINDRYALDGQRLILKTGTYGADGAEYQTENYSNLRIVSKGTDGHGPNYFEVYYPDGSKAVYGLNNVKTITEFPISYSENPQGIRISYEYTTASAYVTNTLFISSIKYGTKGIDLPINQVNFLYKDRTRNDQIYVAGLNVFCSKILSDINVVGNGSSYRNYTLTHNTVTGLGYERLTTIQELDGTSNYGFAPIYFNYDNTNSVVATSNSNLSYSGVDSQFANMITGDFNGNGQMDMILYKTSPKNQAWYFLDPKSSSPSQSQGIPLYPGSFEEVFPATLLSYDNKIKAGDSFVFVKYKDIATVKFELWGANNQSGAVKLDSVFWTVPTKPGYYCEAGGTYFYPDKIPREFLAGDFNGDGLTDVLSVSKPYNTLVNCNGGGIPQTVSTVHFINLDRRITSGFVTQSGNLPITLGTSDKLYAADFNGDGKTDLIVIKSGSMYVYGLDANNNLISLFSYTDSRITTNYNALMGDYNGDGKTDVMFPTSTTAPGNSLFAMFLSTGTAFQKIEQTYPFTYEEPHSVYTDNSTYKAYLGRLVIANDINGDGKTDIIKCSTYTDVYTNATHGDVSVQFYNNTGAALPTGAPLFGNNVSKTLNDVLLEPYPLPIFFSANQVNFDRQFAVASGSSMHLFNYEKDLTKETSITQVTQDGVNHYIEYQPLVTGAGSVYESSDSRVYPYISMEQSPGLKVVKKLRRNFNSQDLIQVFRYKNAVSNIEGLGFLGFGQTTRSNWITDESDVNKIYSFTITDPLLRGATIRSFTTKNPDFNSTIRDKPGMPADIVLNAAVNSAQTTEALQSITLADGFSANGSNGTYIAKISDPATGINDGAAVTDYITRTDYTYNTQLLSNKVFINSSLATVTKDLLSKTNTLYTYAYDNYYNVTKQTINFTGAGSKTTDITYDNNPGGGYIGRPLTKKETATNNSSSFSTEEQYTYTGFLPTQVKRRGNGTPFITENKVYDTYGNVTNKTVVTGDGSRTTSMQYDISGRFITKSTDVEGLETNYTYNANTGTLSTKTNPFSQTTTYTYDRWGRLAQETDYLGKNNYTNYWTSGFGMTIDEFNDEGNQKTTQVDPIGKTLSVTSRDVLGQMVTKEYKYDIYDRQIKEGEPAIGANNLWNQTDYDDYGRIKKVTLCTGKITNFDYDGLKTTVNDGVKTVVTTKDALGNVISTQDPGGTINNSYFANGNLKSADYSGSIQSVEQDGWGRKTKLTDPSAGVYTYSYNEFGEILTEVNPKGTTTYTYDTNGKLLAKQITGDASTNMNYAYTYDAITKLPTTTTLTNSDGNNTNYTYSYDSNKRLITTVEDNAYARFAKTLTYDSFGRIATEANEAKNKSNNLIKSKTVLNVYQNGDLIEIKENVSGQSIWKISALNARGQVTTALLGTNLKDSKVYDQYGLPQGVRTDKVSGTPTQLMSVGYIFNVQRGNLTSRVTDDASIIMLESFSYDTQDRLTAYTDVNGNQQTLIYDERGRITGNSRLGSYTYNGASYKQTGLTDLTDFAKYLYQNQPLQNVTFNAFKQPVLIEEHKKDKIFFQYNGGLQRSHMYWGDSTASTKDVSPFKRHYSEDGSMEITEGGGSTNFVFYLGGDAYSAPAIWKEVVTATTTIGTQYYLHRDYLGSILMITDATGAIKERRHFDAWGNIAKLIDGAGNTLTAFAILDRGYTGHEHLLSVGLINMNGRLYDPILHRFFSPDNNIQNPGNTQNFNRYGYVLNNPLKYNDPKGEFFIQALIGAAVGVVTNGFSNLANGQNFFKGAGKAALMGAIQGALSFGIGSLTGSIAKSAGSTLATVFQTAAHGLLGGTMSAINGGSFKSGLLSGAVGSLAAGATQGLLDDPKSFIGSAEIVLNGAVLGGLSSSMSGGNFWDGVRNGAISAGLNHLFHLIQEDGDGGKRNDGKGNKFRGGKQDQRDQDMKKYPKGFKDWYHKNTKDYKLPGQPDPDLSEPYQDWLELGKPRAYTTPQIRYYPKISPVPVVAGAGIVSLVATYWWLGLFAL